VIISIILGVIQGLGEFLPISSSGHLVLVHYFIDSVAFDADLSFDVALHFGTLLAALVYFNKELQRGIKKIWQLLLKYETADKKKRKTLIKNSRELKFIVILMIATIPGALAGFFLDDLAESLFRDPILIAKTLFFYAIFLWIADRYYLFQSKKKKKDSANNKLKITFSKAIIIGFSQALAIVPGTSRSGATITAALFLGLNRIHAARFSFMLAVPIIFGATLVKIPDLFFAQINIFLVLIGTLASFFVGFLSIKYMLKYLTSKSYTIFVIYRIALAVAIWIFMNLRT
jgi:undecaprenyl-diphosphatase